MSYTSEQLGRTAVRGAAASLSARALGLVVQVASVAVLSRFLEPRDYGLVAMVLAVIGVGEIFRDFGLSSAAIQAPTLSRAQRDNLWWWNAGAGLTLTLVAAALAPVMAALYAHPEVLQIGLALAPTFFVSGLTTQYRADLLRRMRFPLVAWTELGAAVVALGGGVVVAVLGGGYWALVAQQVASGVIAFVGLAVAAHWRPRAYRRDVPMRALFTFGSAVLGSQTVTYLSRNMDTILIGRLFGAHSLGLYNRGLQLVRIPLGQLQGPIATVALSVLSKVQRDDERFMEFVRRGQLILAYPLVIIAAALSATAPLVVQVALGPGWSESAPLLRLVAIGEGLNMLSTAASWIYLSRGLSQSLMRYTFFSASLRLVFLIVGSNFGMTGVATAYAIVPVILWPISLRWSGRVAGLDTTPLLLGSLRIVLVAGVAGLATYAVTLSMQGLAAPVALVLALLVHGTVVGAAALVPVVRRDYASIWRAARASRARG